MRRRYTESMRRVSLTLCSDCGEDAWHRPDGTSEEFYVSNDLWRAACPQDPQAILCIGCFEKRIGRQSVAVDFLSTSPWTTSGPISERLASRFAS